MMSAFKVRKDTLGQIRTVIGIVIPLIIVTPAIRSETITLAAVSIITALPDKATRMLEMSYISRSEL